MWKIYLKLYDNKIIFNKEEKITILLGPNGCGKTTMLVMLEAILSLNHNVLLKYKFDFIELEVDDKVLKITKKIKGNDNKENVLRYFINGVEINIKNNDKKETIDNIEREWTVLNEKILNERMHNDRLLTRYITTDDYEYIYMDNKVRKRHFVKNTIPNEVMNILENYKNDAYFISTNRITTTIKNSDYNNKNEIKNTIQVFSDELKTLLKNKLTEYANLSQKLDEEFPSKVIKAISKQQRSDISDLEKKITEINDLRNKIISAGILEHNSENWLKVDLKNIDPSTNSMLTIYYQDTEKKLLLLSNIADKLSLLLEMVNKKLGENKTINVSSTNGIQIFQKTSDKTKTYAIDLDNLSSGEQQEIILLYELVFKTSDKHFLLIDEPEISLHVMWQRQFIDDIKKIIKINNFNIVIATHSPQIINDNWNLTNVLGEVE